MPDAQYDSKDAPDELFYVSRNAGCPGSTIIFLHGLGSSQHEFADVVAVLEKDHHILAVDLPRHGGSASVGLDKPFTLSLAASYVSSIIRKYAHDGCAHVVGLSTGGFVTLKLVEEHPDIVKSVWITGAAPFEGSRVWFAKRPGLYFYLEDLARRVPSPLVDAYLSWQGIKMDDELRHVPVSNRKETYREVFASILEITDSVIKDVGSKGKRILTVAGGKHDDVASTRKTGQILRESGSPDSLAAVVRKAVHPWDLQFPDLFAASVKAWINGSALPKEFEIL